MADSLSTIGSIAHFIQTSFNSIPIGLSGVNLIALVDSNRQHVANYVGTDIGSNSISDQFQPPIVSLSKADVIDFVQAQAGGERVSLKKLYVGNLPWSVDDAKLKDLFAKYASVVSAVVISDKMTGRSRGFGFVEFSDGAEADKAVTEMNDTDIEGRKLVVNEARPREDSRQ